MHDDELRLIVRAAVARHLGHVDARAACPTPPAIAGESARTATAAWKSHLSHGRFVFLAPTEPDAPCVVEPAVRCHHCGFCQSYGH